MTFSPAINILYIICSSLKVAGGIIALGDEDVVVYTTF
jgi:hypothetical protein